MNWGAVLERQIEAGHGDKPAVIGTDRTLTYAGLRDECERMGALLTELGVHREQRVLLVLDDSTLFHVAFLGAMRIGAVPVPVSTLDKDANFRHFVDDSYAQVVVAEDALLPRLTEVLSGRELTFLAAGSPELADALASADPGAGVLVDAHDDDVAFWLYSSGSTGLPKGVVHLHGDIGVTCERFAGEVLGLSADDIVFSTTKLQHAYGLGNALTFPLHFGATSVLLDGPPRPERIAEVVSAHRPTVYCSVPALFAAVLRAEGLHDLLESVRLCTSAAEALPPVTYDRWVERYGVEIVDGIGSTEMLHIFCSNRPGEIVRGSTGRPVPGYALRLTDPLSGAVLDGEAVGNLEAAGGSCAPFYWHQREKSRASMRGEWFVTGDRYRRDADGVYWYEGRADDMLKIGGLWVSPVDMEGVLMEHPSVLSVGVVDVKVEEQSRIAAYLIVEDGHASDTLADELRSWCKDRMRRYEYPHVVHFVTELPRTVNGKVQRFRLREASAATDATADPDTTATLAEGPA